MFQKHYPDGSTVEYDYDLAGRLSKVIDTNGTYTFT
ncbi:MAG: RHS repeat protein [Acidobacteriia bacterium]|nr:RHS repeat protein [Terriglobia bacterium]